MNKLEPMELGKQKLAELKKKFKALTKKEREELSLSLHKINLGVENQNERKCAQNFLGNFPIALQANELDNILGYLHSEVQSKPEEYLSEDSLSEISVSVSKSLALPDYNQDELETLKEGTKPFAKPEK